MAKDNAFAARGFRQAVGEAARLIGAHPDAGRIDLRLAPAHYRFWSLTRFHYVLVYEMSWSTRRASDHRALPTFCIPRAIWRRSCLSYGAMTRPPGIIERRAGAG